TNVAQRAVSAAYIDIMGFDYNGLLDDGNDAASISMLTIRGDNVGNREFSAHEMRDQQDWLTSLPLKYNVWHSSHSNRGEMPRSLRGPSRNRPLYDSSLYYTFRHNVIDGVDG